jgi:hypothetical protein
MMSSEPVKRTDTPGDALGDYREEHPAFGQVTIHRVNHGPGKFALYGAASDSHMTTVRLVISRSERSHGLSKDWYFAKGELIEIEMTSLQFADLMTSFNMGGGVPCTIRHTGGKLVPEIPAEDTNEIGRIREGFKKEMQARFSADGIRAAREEIRKILTKKTILKSDRERLDRLTEGLLGEIEHNVPFVMDQYAEAAGKVESEVKKEVAAFTQNVIERAGMTAISGMGSEEQHRLLDGKKEGE